MPNERLLGLVEQCAEIGQKFDPARSPAYSIEVISNGELWSIQQLASAVKLMLKEKPNE